MIELRTPPEKKLELRPRGLCCMTPGSAGSTPSAMAGRVSVTRLIQRR